MQINGKDTSSAQQGQSEVRKQDPKRYQRNWDCCRKEENKLSSAFTLYETNGTELALLGRSFSLDIRGNHLRLGW